MDGWNIRKIEVLLISLTLLVLVLFGARAHAESRLGRLEGLRSWKQETLVREDLAPREKDLRLDLIDRLIFQTERKFKEDSFQKFLVQTLEDMADTDELTINQSFGSLSDFMFNLRDSLELIERNEDPLVFVQNFTEFSSISEPKGPGEFANSRSYYDGRRILPAQPMDLQEAANYVDDRELKAEQSLVENVSLLYSAEDALQFDIPMPRVFMLQNSLNP